MVMCETSDSQSDTSHFCMGLSCQTVCLDYGLSGGVDCRLAESKLVNACKWTGGWSGGAGGLSIVPTVSGLDAKFSF
jgi:hypothetical protein